MKTLYNMLEGKKTLLYAVVTMILGLIPGVRDWMSAHPMEAVQINGAIVAILRLLTKKALI